MLLPVTAGCSACAAPASNAAFPNATIHQRTILMLRPRSETVRAALGHQGVKKSPAIDASGQHRHRRCTPVVTAVEHREVTMVVDHEYEVIRPRLFEFRFRDRTRALGRIADQHASRKYALDHHEMAVTVLVDQHDRGQARLLQFLQRHDESIGLETQCREKPFDVQQRKPFLADPGAIAMREHRRERRLFAHRIAVLVGEQRGHSRRAATEIVFLVDRVAETSFLERGHVQAVIAARDAGQLRAACPREDQPKCEQPGKQRDASIHGCICTFTTVAFWIRTLLPVFWITIGKSAALPNEPPPIQFMQVLTFSVDVSETLPVMVMFSLTSLPPLRFASTELATPEPRPATKGVLADALAGALAGGGHVDGPAAKAPNAHAMPRAADADLQNFSSGRMGLPRTLQVNLAGRCRAVEIAPHDADPSP